MTMKKMGLIVALLALIGAGAIYALTSASGSASAVAAPALSTQSQDVQPGCADACDCEGDCSRCPHTSGSADCQKAHAGAQCQGHASGIECNDHGSGGGGCGGHGPKGGA